MRPVTENRKRTAGFTLIELMVVVLVVALAAGLGGGLYVGSYKRMMVEKAARDVWLMAKYARIAAIEQQQNLYLQIDKTSQRAWVATTQFDPSSTDVEVPGALGVIRNAYCRPVDLPQGVEFETLSVGPTGSWEDTEAEEYPRVLFRPNGTAQPAVIVIGDGTTQYGITISGATGTARLVLDVENTAAELSVDLEAE